MLDLAAYFARLGIDRPRAPSREALDAIALAHVSTIPFENLDVLLGRGISLELADIERKLVTDRRGGYCFEHNTLLLHVLDALGFQVAPLSARVRLQRPRDFIPPRTHVFVRVDLGGDARLIDVGVGGLSPTASLALGTEAEQPTPHEPRRIIPVDLGRGTAWMHQAFFGGEWHDVCEFTGEEMPPIDREVGNWFTSAHPASHFRSRLVVARAQPNGVRFSILNREATVRDRAGATTEVLTDPDRLLALLAERFGLVLPAGTRLACPGLDWP